MNLLFYGKDYLRQQNYPLDFLISSNFKNLITNCNFHLGLDEAFVKFTPESNFNYNVRF